MKEDQSIGINGLFLRKPGTGIGQVTRNFLETLAEEQKEDFQYKVYVDNPHLRVPLGPNGTLVYVKPWWKRDDLIRKLLWEHIQLPRRALADALTSFLSLYQAPTEFPKSLHHVMIVHDLIPEIFPAYLANGRSRLLWKLTKRAIRKASILVAVSQSTKKDIEKHLSVREEKIKVAYPSINPLFFRESPLDDENQRKVLERYQLSRGYLYHGGGLEIRKNTESLLTAYASWRACAVDKKTVPPLVISGTIHSKENALATDVEGLIQKLQLEDAVTLLGFVPDEDLPVLYRNASLFIFPSLYEGFGMPVIEALSQGTPVVAVRNSSLGEVGGESVFWVETLTKENLESSYQHALLDSPEARSTRILQARNFKSWPMFAEKIVETLIQ